MSQSEGGQSGKKGEGRRQYLVSCLSSTLLLYYAIGTVHTQESKTKLLQYNFT